MPSLEPSMTLDEEVTSDLLYLARTAELQELKELLAELSKAKNKSELQIVDAAVDGFTGNTCVHYAAANGHKDIIECIAGLDTGSASADVEQLLAKQNLSGNTPLHYAALNGNLDVVKYVVELISPEARSSLINCKNSAGHDAAFEAEGNDKTDVVSFLLGVLDEADNKETSHGDEAVGSEDFGDAVDQDIAAGASKPNTEAEVEEAGLRMSEAELNDTEKT